MGVLLHILGILLLGGCQSRGHFQSLDRDSTYLLSAPHGDFDTHTGDIVEAVCESVPWDCLIARGYRTTERPINVNRPTEGLRLSGERVSEDAERVYARYRNEMRKLTSNPDLYVELHGNIRPGSQNRIEIAYVGMSAKRLARLREIFNQQLAAVGLGDYSVLLEGEPDFYYTASSAKRVGVLREVRHALHIEVPIALRAEHREAFTQALIATLRQL